MTFENPQPPEGINTSQEHPLRNFAILLAGASILFILIVVLLGWFGSSIARLIPFETELKLTRQFDPPESENNEVYIYLNQLKQRVVEAMELEPDYRILLRYKQSETVNAYATLGGNIILFRGLLKALPHENALAMLMAHEIAHIKHRDPIVGMGRGILVQLGLASVFGKTPQVDNIFGTAGVLHTMRYSRKMETQADEAALKAVVKIYGHAGGSTDLFEILGQLREHKDSKEPTEFFSTHPLDQNRIERIEHLAKENQWENNGATTPLPDSIRF